MQCFVNGTSTKLLLFFVKKQFFGINYKNDVCFCGTFVRYIGFQKLLLTKKMQSRKYKRRNVAQRSVLMSIKKRRNNT